MALSCLAILVRESDTEKQIFFAIWVIAAMIVWGIILHFIVSFIRTGKLFSNTKTSKFNVLTIIATLNTGFAAIFQVIMSFYYIHYIHPVSSINYSIICDKQANDFATFNSFFWNLWLFGSTMFDGNYVYIICVYFYRLIIIFENSSFAVQWSKKVFFGIIVVILLINIIITHIFWGAYHSPLLTTYSSLTFIGIYLCSAVYLCYLLKKKFTGLIKMIMQLIEQKVSLDLNTSHACTPTHMIPKASNNNHNHNINNRNNNTAANIDYNNRFDEHVQSHDHVQSDTEMSPVEITAISTQSEAGATVPSTPNRVPSVSSASYANVAQMRENTTKPNRVVSDVQTGSVSGEISIVTNTNTNTNTTPRNGVHVQDNENRNRDKKTPVAVSVCDQDAFLDQSKKLYSQMKKFTILACFSFAFTMSYSMFVLLGWVVFSDVETQLFSLIYVTSALIEDIINLVCITAQFSFAEKIYLISCKKFEHCRICQTTEIVAKMQG